MRILPLLLLAASLALFTASAHAQDLRYRAVLTEDGSIEIVPFDDADTSSPTDNSSSLLRMVRPDSLYLWTDEVGAIKGILADQERVSTLALAPGDAIRTYATASFDPLGFLLPSEEDIQKMLKDLVHKLVTEARDQACSFVPRPTTVTPAVSVAFGVGVSATASIEATWTSDELCNSQRN